MRAQVSIIICYYIDVALSRDQYATIQFTESCESLTCELLKTLQFAFNSYRYSYLKPTYGIKLTKLVRNIIAASNAHVTTITPFGTIL